MFRNILSSYCSSVSPALELGLSNPFISLFCGVMLPGVIRIGLIADDGLGCSIGVAMAGGDTGLGTGVD